MQQVYFGQSSGVQRPTSQSGLEGCAGGPPESRLGVGDRVRTQTQEQKIQREGGTGTEGPQVRGGAGGGERTRERLRETQVERGRDHRQLHRFTHLIEPSLPWGFGPLPTRTRPSPRMLRNLVPSRLTHSCHNLPPSPQLHHPRTQLPNPPGSKCLVLSLSTS